jgi:chromosome partitioning protein
LKTITVTSEKGGTGKTLISTHVAALLAARGRRVLLVDFDPQGHATVSFGLPKEPGLYELLVRGVDIVDVIRQPDLQAYVPQGMQPRGRLYILPGNDETHGVVTMVRDVRALTNALEDVEHFIDVVIIDTAPSPGMLLTLAYHATNYVLIPAKMEYLSIDGLLSTINAMQAWDVQLMGIVPNLFRSTTDLHQYHYSELCKLADDHGWPVWEPIPQRIVWAEASTLQQMVYTLEGAAGKARIDAVRLADRVEAVLNG